jgi:hypothetical protein
VLRAVVLFAPEEVLPGQCGDVRLARHTEGEDELLGVQHDLLAVPGRR